MSICLLDRRLAEAKIAPPVCSVGESYDTALAEPINLRRKFCTDRTSFGREKKQHDQKGGREQPDFFPGPELICAVCRLGAEIEFKVGYSDILRLVVIFGRRKVGSSSCSVRPHEFDPTQHSAVRKDIVPCMAS